MPGARTEGGRTEERAPRLGSLTGLRFVAALLVFWYHFCFIFGLLGLRPFTDVPPRAFLFGATGVSFFFLLSGFVLCWSHDPLDRPTAFYRRRFARIYPAYFLVLFAAALLKFLHGEPAPDGIAFVAALLLVQAWIPVETIFTGVLPVSWTLSDEAFFYASFPALIGRLASLSPVRRRSLMLALLALTAILGFAFSRQAWGVANPTWLLVFFPPARIAEFMLGILLAMEVRDGRFPQVSLKVGLVVVGLGLIVAGTPSTYTVGVMVAPFMVLIAAAAYRDLQGRPTVFAAPWFVTLGAWSYAFYLVHGLVLAEVWWFMARFGGGVAGRPLLVGGAVLGVELAITLAVSGMLYTWVERPMERRLRGAPVSSPR